MRSEKWERKIKNDQLTPGEHFMLVHVYEAIKHGNKQHRQWLKRMCLELGCKADITILTAKAIAFREGVALARTK